MKKHLFVILMLVACTPRAESVDSRHNGHENIPSKVYEIDGPGGFMADHILDVTLPDGTRCIIHYPGGISCNFVQPEQKEKT